MFRRLDSCCVSSLLLLLLGFVVGCEELADILPSDTAPTASVSGTPVERDPESVTIASFNIQVFGVSKSKKPDVMQVLADVVRRFDVVAIQEIRATDQTVLPRFVDLVNAEGAAYDFVLGPRLGRTSSKEQYAFVFDSTRIEVDRSSVDTIPDSRDLLHREPLVARFRARGKDGETPFSFTLVNIHTDPDEVREEVDVLDDVLRFVRRTMPEEDDVILLGDLNADESKFGELGEVPNLVWLVADEPTNVRGTETYDNLLFDGRQTAEYTGRGGVFNLLDEYGLSEAEALKVSDHHPVWGAFDRREAGAERVARMPR